MNNEPLNKAEFIKKSGVYMSTPQGNSMRPFIHGGRDSVAMRAFDGRPEKYDVILYISKDRHVMHRVLKVKNGVCTVRGDNCYYTERVPFDAIMAKMDHILKDGKRVVRQTAGLRLLIALWRYAYPVRYCLHQVKRAFGAVVRRAKK